MDTRQSGRCRHAQTAPESPVSPFRAVGVHRHGQQPGQRRWGLSQRPARCLPLRSVGGKGAAHGTHSDHQSSLIEPLPGDMLVWVGTGRRSPVQWARPRGRHHPCPSSRCRERKMNNSWRWTAWSGLCHSLSVGSVGVVSGCSRVRLCPLWDGPRPGPQRSPEHMRPGHLPAAGGR